MINSELSDDDAVKREIQILGISIVCAHLFFSQHSMCPPLSEIIMFPNQKLKLQLGNSCGNVMQSNVILWYVT